MERSIAEELNDKFIPVNDEIVDAPVQEKAGIDLSVLKAKTGEGSVGDYLDHPMNFNNSQGMARVLRGLTGIVGSLDLAIIDIVVGVLDLLKTTKKGVVENGLSGKFGGIS